MGRIQSSVGLITGIPIAETVNQLMALAAQPRDTLLARRTSLQATQGAVVDLTALTLGVQLAARRLGVASLFSQRTVSSSNTALLTATATSAVPPGQYQFTPVQTAQSHHLVSSGLAMRDEPLGAGEITFRFGGTVNEAASLDDLNGGAGVARGKIRITDRSGATSVIDLRYARTIDDVLAAINASEEVEVDVRAIGDRLQIVDQSGGSGNLRVQEVSGGTTAADLGLAGINVAADTATGQDIVELFPGLELARLNDGNGLSLRPELPDLEITFRDGSAALSIDLDPADDPAPRTLEDLLERINAADPARLQAQTSADGARIELTDLTTNTGGTFAVTSPVGGSVAAELGLTGSSVGDTISGRRLLSGLKTTLLSSLRGGSGLGSLGEIDLTDRTGDTATVDLAGAETLDDVIAAINASGLELQAEYNAARNGLRIVDASGSTVSNLIVADGDATNTATSLGLAADVAADQVNSGSLARQVVSRSTLLSSLNGGGGVGSGTILITDSAGQASTLNLTQLDAETVGDAIDAINALTVGVTASLNADGDGILLTDTAAGTGTLTVANVGSGRAATDLHLLGQATGTTLDGSTTITVAIDADDTLEDLVAKINALSAGVSASVLSDGSGSLRHHLSLLSNVSGLAGQLLVDGTGAGLDFDEAAPAQDAVLQLGSGPLGALADLVHQPVHRCGRRPGCHAQRRVHRSGDIVHRSHFRRRGRRDSDFRRSVQQAPRQTPHLYRLRRRGRHQGNAVWLVRNLAAR